MNEFSDISIKFTTEHKKLLRAVISRSDLRTTYERAKIEFWCGEIDKHCEFTKIQPNVAYAALCNGEVHKYTYFQRIIPYMKEYIKPLHDVINNK